MTWKRKLAYGLGGVVLLFALAAAWMLGPALLPPKNVDMGIAVGARAPVESALLDSKGAPATLAQGMGEKGMVLLLVRSADWCPFCKAQLRRSAELGKPLAAQGYRLASLSYDKPELLAGFQEISGIGMEIAMYSDPGSKLIDALGLRDPNYQPGDFAYGVPRPAVLVLAADGTVKAKFVDADYRSRQSNEQVLAMVRDIP